MVLLSIKCSEMPSTYSLLANSSISLKPWVIIRSEEESEELRAQRRIELPDAPDCIPFARRRDNDDIAALEIDASSAPFPQIRGVITDHLSWVAGKDPMAKPKAAMKTENISFSSQSIVEWLQSKVVPDIIEWGDDPAAVLEFIAANQGACA